MTRAGLVTTFVLLLAGAASAQPSAMIGTNPWSRQKMGGAEITIPYHPALMRFYRER